MSDTPDKPGRGLLGWLGRQVGYVRRAVKTDVTAPPRPPRPPAPEQVVYRADTVEEAPHPAQPNVTLRRTTVDEVIVKQKET